MSLALLYVLLLKATVTSFSGLGSLAQIRQDLVETHRVLTDEELSQAVLVGRTAPGANGSYVVAVGYRVAGWPGAAAGWLAMVTPALAAIPLWLWVQRWLHLARVRGTVDAVIVASAVLLLPAALQLLADGVRQVMRAVG